MAQFVRVPPGQLSPEALEGLLEEFASRDGTDYGERELTLEEKVGNLRGQLDAGELCILFQGESEEWDLLPREEAELLLHE